MSAPIEKTFIQALKEITFEETRVKKYLKDKRISFSEKIVIESYLLYKASNHSKCVSKLSEIKGHMSENVYAICKFLKALASCNYGRYDEAIINFRIATPIIKKLGVEEFTYLLNYNLFILHINLYQLEQAQTYIENLKKFKSIDLYKEAVCQAELTYFVKTDNLVAAKKAKKEVLGFYEKMRPSIKLNFLTTEYCLAAKEQKWSECEKALKEYKKIRKFKITSNYLYMRTMLNFLSQDTSLYVYEKDYNLTDITYLQLKVIKHLEFSETDQALSYWNQLKLDSPKSYGEDFNYTADKCVFSLALKKVLSKKSQIITADINILLPEEKDDALLFLLKTTKGQISKDELFFKIWGREPKCHKDDLMLKNCLYRARRKSSDKIVSKKGFYSLKIAA